MDPYLLLRVGMAKMQGWNEAEARAASLEYLFLLASYSELEAEEMKKETEKARAPGAQGKLAQGKTITYRPRPKT